MAIAASRTCRSSGFLLYSAIVKKNSTDTRNLVTIIAKSTIIIFVAVFMLDFHLAPRIYYEKIVKKIILKGVERFAKKLLRHGN